MSGLQSEDQEPEVLLALLRGQGEQCPGAEAETKRQLFRVRRSYTAAA
jgi:hypothetical protein